MIIEDKLEQIARYLPRGYTLSLDVTQDGTVVILEAPEGGFASEHGFTGTVSEQIDKCLEYASEHLIEALKAADVRD